MLSSWEGPSTGSVSDSLLAEPAELTEQFRAALDQDGLTLHYQPIVDLGGRVVMAEGLLRWPHPEHGLLSAGAILPVAVRAGLLSTLDRWVLRAACSAATRWPVSVSVAVNLGGLLPDGAEAVEQITSLLVETGLDPHRLVLEITETTLVDLPQRTRQVMQILTEQGVRFAIDDFGTGYSSLSRLKDLPAQILKLDRSLLPTDAGDAINRAITQAVFDLTRTTGHQCIAEGVETSAQAQLLCGIGLDAYQGWLWAPAMPAQQLRQYLHRESPRPA